MGAMAIDFALSRAIATAPVPGGRRVWVDLVRNLGLGCGCGRGGRIGTGKHRLAANRGANCIAAAVRVLANGSDHDGEHGSVSRSLATDGLPDSARATLHGRSAAAGN